MRLHIDDPDHPLADQYRRPQPGCEELARPQQHRRHRQAVLLPFEISNDQRFLLRDDEGGQSTQRDPPQGLADPFFHHKAEVHFVRLFIVEGDEESIDLEDGGDLAVHRLHQVIQVKGGAGSTGRAVDDGQPLGPAAGLLEQAAAFDIAAHAPHNVPHQGALLFKKVALLGVRDVQPAHRLAANEQTLHYLTWQTCCLGHAIDLTFELNGHHTYVRILHGCRNALNHPRQKLR